MEVNKTNLELMGINKHDFNMIVCGVSGSGKSHYIRYLFREKMKGDKPWDYGLIFSNTCFEKDAYDYMPSKKYIYENYDEDILRNLIKIQKQNLEKGIMKHAFVLLDDACSEGEFLSPVIKKLFISGRHFNISCILSTQYISCLRPIHRANSNVSVFFRLGDDRVAMEASYNSLGSRFNNFNEFKQFVYENTNDHKFIIWTGDGYKVFKCPEEIPQFKLKFNKKYK